MNSVITKVNDILRDGGFDYAVAGGFAIDLLLGRETRTHGDIDISVFRNQRREAVLHLIKKGYEAYEMLGGGKCRRLTAEDTGDERRSVFAIRPACPLVKLYPTEDGGVFWMEFFHSGIRGDEYIELLFTDRENGFITLGGEVFANTEAIRRRDGIPFLAPELTLYYKSRDYGREHYEDDFKAALPALSAAEVARLRRMIGADKENHPWLALMEDGNG